MASPYDQYLLLRHGANDNQQQSRLIHAIYNLYRLLLALILLISYFYRSSTSPLGAADPSLFFNITIAYTIFNAITLAMPERPLLNSRYMLLYFAIVILADILILAMICFASGGVSSSLAPLLIMPVASGSLLFGMRLSTFFAAVATIALFYGELYLYLTHLTNERYYLQTGLLGLLFFCAALGTQWIGGRIREKDLVNLRQAASIKALQKINQQIIARMQTGIVVVDLSGNILNMNTAARNLMGMAEAAPTPASAPNQNQNQNQTKVPPILQEQLMDWLQNAMHRPTLSRLSPGGAQIQANFAYLQGEKSPNIIIFLEDNSQLSSRAQHLKLMSLGRLTASIAHEIRNPLGAISHAAQLLRETPTLGRQEMRLLDIINTHTQRVNTIIQNILELSRYKPVTTEKIEMGEWLSSFASRLKTAYKFPIQLQFTPPNVPVLIQFNPSQLEQVITNLCDNGLRYSLRHMGEAMITLALDTTSAGTTCLDIIDEGLGVPENEIEQVFEPFFTTETTGTGLGLFICKELCEANQTRLFFQRTADGHSAFRLSFAHPDRRLN
jgi:two-component system, NtrC family, sensor histidine kinase PilS